MNPLKRVMMFKTYDNGALRQSVMCIIIIETDKQATDIFEAAYRLIQKIKRYPTVKTN